MRLKGEFEVVTIGDDTMAVPVGEGMEDNHFVIRLNDSAAEIFEMLKEDVTEEEIISKLSVKYENSGEELGSFVREILDNFSENGII